MTSNGYGSLLFSKVCATLLQALLDILAGYLQCRCHHLYLCEQVRSSQHTASFKSELGLPMGKLA